MLFLVEFVDNGKFKLFKYLKSTINDIGDGEFRVSESTDLRRFGYFLASKLPRINVPPFNLRHGYNSQRSHETTPNS